jgi:hypothetical protein
MSKGSARNSKKGCGGHAAGQAVRIDEFSAAALLKFIAAVRFHRLWHHSALHSAEDGVIRARAIFLMQQHPDLPPPKARRSILKFLLDNKTEPRNT